MDRKRLVKLLAVGSLPLAAVVLSLLFLGWPGQSTPALAKDKDDLTHHLKASVKLQNEFGDNLEMKWLGPCDRGIQAPPMLGDGEAVFTLSEGEPQIIKIDVCTILGDGTLRFKPDGVRAPPMIDWDIIGGVLTYSEPKPTKLTVTYTGVGIDLAAAVGPVD